MRTIVSAEFFSLVDLTGVTRVVAVQAGVPEGECVELWPGAANVGTQIASFCPDRKEGHEVLVELTNLQDPTAVLRLEILARSSVCRNALAAA
jgi:hypothetical protein